MEQKFINVLLDEIIPNKDQPRKFFDDEAIAQLAESIISKGVLSPILLRPIKQSSVDGKAFQIVFGERRYRACLLANKLIEARNKEGKELKNRPQEALNRLIPASVRELTDEEVLDIQITENIQRKDMHPMEEAAAYKFLNEKKKFNVHEISQRLGKNAHYITVRLKFNDLLDEFQKAFYKSRISFNDALNVAKFTHADQKLIYTEATKNNPDKISIDDWMLRSYSNQLSNAPFDIKDDSLAERGSCIGCPKNSATNTILFPDQVEKPVCMDGGCFRGKAKLWYERHLKASTQDPLCVLVSDEHSLGQEAEKIVKKKHPVLSSSEFETITGSGQKAFVVEGRRRGLYIHIKVKRKQSTQELKNKVQTGKVDHLDIQSEITRIEERETRMQELDFEKVTAEIDEQLQKCPALSNPKRAALMPLEDDLLLMYALQEVGLLDADIEKIKVFDELYDAAAFLKQITAATIEQRAMVFRKLIAKYVRGSLSNTDIKAHMMHHLAGKLGVDVNKIIKAQQAIAAVRQVRVTERLKELEGQLKSVKKKGVKV